jgi:hypothetical protein
VNAKWAERQAFYGELHRVADDLIGVYHGSLPPIYDDFFHEEMHVHLVNQIRLAWDDLANLAGKEFPIYVDPDNDTSTAKDRAELQEKIAYWYNCAGQKCGSIDMKMLMKVLMWWLIGVGEAVPMVLPDYEQKTPFFTFRDPRTHYPPVGWTPYTQAAPDDTIFAYQLSIGELMRRYPDSAPVIRQQLIDKSRSPQNTTSRNESTPVWFGEYYSADEWILTTLSDEVIEVGRSETGDPGHPGVMPVVPMSLYSPGSAKGRSLFADQISIQAAMARMFSQKLDYFDRTLYPIIFTTPLSNTTVRVGPFAINEWDASATPGTQPKVDVISPANPIDADQTMSFVMGLSRMLNRNPEQMQGTGPADSSKAISTLNQAVNSTVRDMFWPPAIAALPKLYEKAATMDVNLWGNVSKKASGIRKNSRFTVPYRPNVQLRGRESDFKVEPGAGLAGYQGTLEILQLLGAEAMSEDTALEQLETVREPQKEKRRIQSDRMEKLEWASLTARAQQPPGMPGALKPGAMAKIRRMTEEGKDLFDAIEELEKTGELYDTAPPAPPAGPGGLPTGTNPGEGPAASMLPLPTLNAIRGGPMGAQPAGNPTV